jgi:hypothetical protein
MQLLDMKFSVELAQLRAVQCRVLIAMWFNRLVCMLLSVSHTLVHQEWRAGHRAHGCLRLELLGGFILQELGLHMMMDQVQVSLRHLWLTLACACLINAVLTRVRALHAPG